jgi:nicotinamidase-related amidase
MSKYPTNFVPAAVQGKAKIHLLIIDPQVDFCKPTGSLYVQGADDDMLRLGTMIDRLDYKINQIHVTLDSHHPIDIAHPCWFKDSNGKHPAPLSTIITSKDLEDGVWTTSNPALFARTLQYEKDLEASGRYPHVIWPPHCLIGSVGTQIHPELYEVLVKHETDLFRMVDYVTKGSNPWTEHYSAVKAEVPDPADPSSMLNTRLIQTLQSADIIPIAGEALDYCVANTLRDIMNNFGEENIKKMVILTDATSPVGFPAGLDDAFMQEFLSRGGQTSTTVEFLA